MPVLADLETEITVTEGDFEALLDSNVSVSDGGVGFDGGSLVITGLGPDEQLGFLSDGMGPGQITLSGSALYFEGLFVGVVTFTATGLTINFATSDATAAAVEAVIEHITYVNGSDNPDYYRSLSFALTDANGDLASDGTALFLQDGADDPFHGANLGSSAHTVVGDIDNDGDVDMIVQVYGDGYHLLRNDGTAPAPDFVQDDAALTLSGSTGNAAGMTLYDITGDGFLDLIVGRYGGTIQTFAGDGTFSFTELTGGDNPFNGIQTYSFAAPGLADVDGDGYVDLVVARGGGRFDYFAGSSTGFQQLSGAANPLDGAFNFGGGGSVSFADIDGDGDQDFIGGSAEAGAMVFRNDSTVGNPLFTQIAAVYNQNFNGGPQPVLVDIDNDGDIDQIETTAQGDIQLYLLEPATPAIDVIVNGVDDAANVVDYVQNSDASGTISGNVLANSSDVDNDLEIVDATVNGLPINIGSENVFPDGTRLILGFDGQFTVEPGTDLRNLGAAASGAENTSLQFVLNYRLFTGETGTATLTINGVDDKDVLEGTSGDDVIRAGVGNDIVEGEDGFNQLFGEDGNDILVGGADVDNLDGGAGNDKLYGFNGADTLTGGAGADYMYGENGNDTLIGGADNDYLDGGDGFDAMSGGAGNDVYIVDSGGDTVTEAADEGYDIIRSTVSIGNLAANVEAIQLQGAANLTAIGNSGANNLQGNSGDNVLVGMAGVDTLNGNDGDDTIVGGTGNDLLRGGLGADTFLVNNESVGSAVLETDQVYDFNAAEGDRIDLSGIDANTRLDGDQEFRLVSAFTKYDAAHPELTGQMTLTFAGGITTLRLDVNGDGKVDYQMKINGDVTGDSGGWML